MSQAAITAAAEHWIRASTASGRLLGRRSRGIAEFKGIPYAAAPTGDLRWRPPQPAKRWAEDRPALAFGPAPIQELPLRSSPLFRLGFGDAGALVMSEDCLYLNVWTPEPTAGAKLPVMLWVHGGGNRTGHGGQDLFDGRRLAARGVVVVTVNMRLGALGFLALPELAAEDAHGASGNYGVQDVLAALNWVQENIEAFGGDASRVTLAGNSSGAATVTHLMAAPAARGLFRAAIGQSVSGIFRHDGRMPTHDEAAERGRAAVSRLGGPLRLLRDLPATAFLGVSVPGQGVVIDGRLLTEDSADVFLQGRQAAIPLLVGWNSDEGSLYATPSAQDELRLESYAPGDRATLDVHYPDAREARAPSARRALIGDRRFVYPVWRWARTHAETTGAPTWVYRFDHSPPLPGDLPAPPDGGKDYGCFHTAELPYTWDNLDARPWPWQEADRELAHRLADAWVRFVADADPNGGGLPIWQRFSVKQDRPVMGFGSACAPRPEGLHRREAFEAFDRNYFGATP